jgi:hypothetical protein
MIFILRETRTTVREWACCICERTDKGLQYSPHSMSEGIIMKEFV